MKKLLLFAFLFTAVCSASAQFRKTVELKPIAKRGFNYFYDLKRMRSPYALQMPLLAMENEEINKRYQRFERLSIASDLIVIAPYLFLVSDLNRGGIAAMETFFIIFFSSVGASLTLDLLAHRQLRKGIDRYNQLLVMPSSNLPGMSIRYRF